MNRKQYELVKSANDCVRVMDGFEFDASKNHEILFDGKRLGTEPISPSVERRIDNLVDAFFDGFDGDIYKNSLGEYLLVWKTECDDKELYVTCGVNKTSD